MRETSKELLVSGHDAEVSETRALVTNILKAPATAKFDNWRVYSNPEKDQLIITGTVDSQNSFGALLRATFADVYYTDPKTGKVTRRGEFYDQNSEGVPTFF